MVKFLLEYIHISNFKTYIVIIFSNRLNY